MGGFHDKEEDLTSKAWDVKEAIRAIKDEEMDLQQGGDDEPHKWVIIWAHFCLLTQFNQPFSQLIACFFNYIYAYGVSWVGHYVTKSNMCLMQIFVQFWR